VDPQHVEISIARQCELMGLARSSYYYQPATTSEQNLKLMRLLDEQYMREPSWGSPRMTACLREETQEPINHKRVERLMALMGLQGLLPRKKHKTSCGPKEQVFPYLLNKIEVTRSNQAWCSDITYIPMPRGFMYLVAIMDWYSRYVLSWELSNSLETTFCLDALEVALRRGVPEIFNSDKGCQYTSEAFVSRLLEEEIQPSMTSRGRCWDNIFIERLWWSVKYENVYLKEYKTVPALYQGLSEYFDQYNEVRPHQSLNYQTPREVYYA
jgi:putative transposase